MSDDQISNTPDNESPYSPEELMQAAEAVQTLTPEAYLEMVAMIRSIDEQSLVPEACGYVWTKMHGPDGAEITVGTRSFHPIQAFKALSEGVNYIKGHSNLRTSSQAQPAPAAPTVAQGTAPQQAPSTSQPASPESATAGGDVQGGESDLKLKLTHIAKAFSTNGNPYLIAKTEDKRFAKYGIRAWPEVLPPDLAFDQMDPGVQLAPPLSMTYALYSPTEKKIKSFLEA
jgi:hypothetical protein